MTRLLLIRHGQSEANLGGFFAGHLDSPPTPLGLRQAEAAAEYVTQTYRVDAVYTSDLQRAAAVGEAVAARAGVSAVPDIRLREIFAGQWEGLSFEELMRRFPSFGVWLTDIGSVTCDGGESVRQLQARILLALTEIALRHEGRTVVIATHATPIRAMQCSCSGQPVSYMKEIPWVSNASVTELIFQKGVFSLGKVGEDGFLGEAVSRLPVNV